MRGGRVEFAREEMLDIYLLMIDSTPADLFDSHLAQYWCQLKSCPDFWSASGAVAWRHARIEITVSRITQRSASDTPISALGIKRFICLSIVVDIR